MTDTVTITVRVGDQTAPGFRDVNGRVRDMNGRFATAAGDMQRSSAKASASINGLKATLLSLAPAAVPVAAAMGPVAVQAGAAGLAVAAFGAAVIPQISNLADAAKAQTKYTDAVTKYGRGSKQATQAQLAQQQALEGMPVATQRASAAYSNLREQFKTFSDSTAKFTMAPVEKSFVVLGQIVPRLKPMVEGTATQFDRLMKVAGGGVSTKAFDALSERVSTFSNNALKGATDKVISFMRALSEGNASGPLMSFMEYAREQGPAVRELLTNVSQAVSNLLEGASQAGPGLLTLVNAMAKLVASVPPELVGNLMQIYAAFKLIKLAGAGVGAMAGGFATLGTNITALRAASTAAGGGLTGMNAALNTLSTGGKAMLAAGAVGALVLAMHELSDNKAPVAVDELSSSLNTLASTGKLTGVLSTNLDEMASSIAMVSKGASDNGLATMISDFGAWSGLVSGPSISDAKKNVDAWDKSMANLVRGGKPKEAAAQFEILKKAWLAGGGGMDRLKKTTNDYQNALADQRFEQQMAAESMGMFGQAALDTQAKLDTQKQSADGLRQSIMALNDTSRSAFDAQTRFEEALDKVTASIKDNGASLDIGSEKGRANRDALSGLATATQDAAAKARENGASWAAVNGIFDKGRKSIIDNAFAITHNRKEAERLADQLLKTPNKTAKLQGNIEDLEAKIKTARGKLANVPNSRRAKLLADISDLQAKITAARAALAGVNGKTATTYVVTKFSTVGSKGSKVPVAKRDYAAGGKVRGYAGGGDVQAYPDGGYIEGPGSGTSDSILTMLGSGNVVRSSNTEFIVNAEQTAKHRRLLELINSGQLPRFAKGGLTDAEKSARASLRGQMSTGGFGRAAGYNLTSFEKGLGAPSDMSSLVNALNQAKQDVRAATRGKTESALLRTLDSVGKRLIGQEKALGRVNASLEKAKDKLDSLKSAAAQLSDSVKGGVLSSANITKGASGGGPVTVASIMGGLTASRDKATAFAGALKGLKGKGLSASLIQQIGEAGIEGGGLETAGALLGASSSEIGSINSLQKQINSAAGSAGKATADAVYGQAIKAQTAAVNRLQKSQDRLEKSMAALAKTLERAISRAIGKKAAGGIVGAAAAGGMRGGLTWVGEQEPELLDLPVGSRVWSGPDSRRKAAAPWESMLNTPRRAPGGVRATAPAGRPEPVVIELRSSGSEVDEFLIKMLRRAINNRGGNVQVVLTGRR